jgi:hypothetical protein
MAARVSRPAEQTGQRGRLWWLPAGGCGNGLDDEAWAPVLEISEKAVSAVLSALGQVGVPAYAAPARSGASRLRDHTRQPAGYQLWVGASAYGRAEITLVRVMPSLTREAARHADRAWR